MNTPQNTTNSSTRPVATNARRKTTGERQTAFTPTDNRNLNIPTPASRTQPAMMGMFHGAEERQIPRLQQQQLPPSAMYRSFASDNGFRGDSDGVSERSSLVSGGDVDVPGYNDPSPSGSAASSRECSPVPADPCECSSVAEDSCFCSAAARGCASMTASATSTTFPLSDTTSAVMAATSISAASTQTAEHSGFLSNAATAANGIGIYNMKLAIKDVKTVATKNSDSIGNVTDIADSNKRTLNFVKGTAEGSNKLAFENSRVLERVEADVAGLKVDVARLKVDVAGLKDTTAENNAMLKQLLAKF